MTEVSRWITSLGNAFVRYAGVFEENGVDNLALLGHLQINDMVEDLGVKRTHARMIYHRYKKEFIDTKPESLKPSVVRMTEKSKLAVIKDDEKKEEDTLDFKGLAVIFSEKVILEKLLKYADGKDVMAKALSLVHEQLNYLSKLQKWPPAIEHQGFLSHVQKNSADLCRSLFYGLKEKQTTVWFDMTARRLDARGMAGGISTSKYFVLIATKNSFNRPWPLYELLVAQILSKPIIVAVETDSRHGGLTFDEFVKTIPEPWAFLKSHEFMKIERRGSFWLATVDELHRRLNVDTKEEEETMEMNKSQNDGAPTAAFRGPGFPVESDLKSNEDVDANDRSAAEIHELIDKKHFYDIIVPSRPFYFTLTSDVSDNDGYITEVSERCPVKDAENAITPNSKIMYINGTLLDGVNINIIAHYLQKAELPMKLTLAHPDGLGVNEVPDSSPTDVYKITQD